jgi:ubiquinone biosynthesis protein COQ9
LKSLKDQYIEKFISIEASCQISEEYAQLISEEIYGKPKAYFLDFTFGLKEIVSSSEEYLDNLLQFETDILNEKSITQKIKQLLYSRIYGKSDRKNFYKALSNYYFKRSNIPEALKNRWNTVSYIWDLAGDNSLDFNYYSKRSILYAIYNKALHNYSSSNELGFEETSKIIDKSLENVGKFNKFKKNISLSNIPFIRLFTK